MGTQAESHLTVEITMLGQPGYGGTGTLSWWEYKWYSLCRKELGSFLKSYTYTFK